MYSNEKAMAHFDINNYTFVRVLCRCSALVVIWSAITHIIIATKFNILCSNVDFYGRRKTGEPGEKLLW